MSGVSLQAQGSVWEQRAETHQRSLQLARLNGGAYLATAVSIYDLYRNTAALDRPDPEAVQRYGQRFELTANEVLTPIGTTSTWAFPEFVQAPRVRFQGPSPYLTPVYEPFCVPLSDPAEYRRLIVAEAEIFRTLVKHFPAVDHWMIGSESPPEFLSCSNRRLQAGELAVFVADVVEAVSKAVKRENPAAAVIFHFLGTERAHLYAGDVELSPLEFQKLLLEEISARGGSSPPYDLLSSDVEPKLLEDRQAAGSVAPLTEEAAGSGTAAASGSGWQIKHLERFEILTSDLISSYPDWVEWRLAGAAEQTTDEVVMGSDFGRAQIRLFDPPPPPGQFSVGGARSEANSVAGANDYVPDSDDFSNDNSVQDDLWTAVNDFFAAGGAGGPHANAFLRVNDRIWSGKEDQTRMGSIAFSAPLSRNAAQCNNGGGTASELLGALQLTGDDLEDPGTGRTWLACFNLTRDPWAGTSTSNPGGDFFRLQILESTTFNALVGVKTEWKAEVWDLSGGLIGESNWISHFTLVEFFGIGVPELLDSRIGFGFGPSSESVGIDVERTATAFWIF